MELDAIKLERINQGESIEDYCKGECAGYISHLHKNVCRIKPVIPTIKCPHLYDFTYLKNACLHNHGGGGRVAFSAKENNSDDRPFTSSYNLKYSL
jgi:hypothetical protein